LRCQFWQVFLNNRANNGQTTTMGNKFHAMKFF
jgi:hypothetical protein